MITLIIYTSINKNLRFFSYFQNKLQSFIYNNSYRYQTNKIITIIINVKTIAPSKHLSAISYFSSIDSVALVLYFTCLSNQSIIHHHIYKKMDLYKLYYHY